MAPHLIPENPRTSALIAVVVHIIWAVIYAVLGGFQFSSALRRLRSGWHRDHLSRWGWLLIAYCACMQAAVHTEYGSPDVVKVMEVDRPTIGATDVLVRVHATTVNRTDCACRAAKPIFMRLFTGLVRPRATVLGNEFAGVVADESPRRVRRLHVDRNYATPSLLKPL